MKSTFEGMEQLLYRAGKECVIRHKSVKPQVVQEDV